MDNIKNMPSVLSCFARAYHAKNGKNPIFYDEAAEKLIGEKEYEMIENSLAQNVKFFSQAKEETIENVLNTQFVPIAVSRAKFCWDRLQSAVNTGARQYVMLGAGLDSFAFGQPQWAKKCMLFEADYAETIKDKIRRVKNAGLAVPENLRFVPADITKNFGERLAEAGFNPDVKSVFSLMGVSYYLTREQLDGIIAELSQISADGSTLLFDFADEKFLTSGIESVRNMRTLAEGCKTPVRTCFSEKELYTALEAGGFLVYELLSYLDIEREYFAGRRDISAFRHINFAQAVFKV